MDYSEGERVEWYSGREECGCGCSEEVALLQTKLAEVHGRLMAQIEICQQQQSRIIKLEAGNNNRSNGKENHGRNWEESREGSEIKNQLLQADLDTMRRRVLAEITQKNRLLEEMGDLKKRHRKELAMEVSKFQGLQILYRKAMSEKGKEPTYEQQMNIPQLQPLEAELAREREQLRKVNAENIRLREALATKEKEGKKIEDRNQGRGKNEGKSRREGRQRSGDGRQRISEQLRELGVLKQQISRINKSINVRQEQGMPMEMKLVGDRWGQRHHH